MYKHFMLVTQPIANVQRIGWSKLVKHPSDLKEIYSVRKKLDELNIENKFSNHLVSLESEDIEMVKDKDSFFEGIMFIDTADNFIDLAETNGEPLEASDVANYILSLKPMTHLKLQKILYICYERFYRATDKLLYTNKIVAFEYGPVTKDVFRRYYRNRSVLTNDRNDDKVILVQNGAISPTVAKVMLSENGLSIMDIVRSVVSQYEDMDPWDLVNLTHEKGTAWDIAFNNIGRNAEITKDIMDDSIAI